MAHNAEYSDSRVPLLEISDSNSLCHELDLNQRAPESCVSLSSPADRDLAHPISTSFPIFVPCFNTQLISAFALSASIYSRDDKSTDNLSSRGEE